MVEFDDSDLWFFRNEEYQLPLTIVPSSVFEWINVSVSGFDGVHWLAVYDQQSRQIDLSNLILESEPVAWVDEQVLRIAARIGQAASCWSWTKKLKLKKRVSGLWDHIK